MIHILTSALLGRVMQVSAAPETIQRGKERHSGLNQVQSAWGDQMTMMSSTKALMAGLGVTFKNEMNKSVINFTYFSTFERGWLARKLIGCPHE